MHHIVTPGFVDRPRRSDCTAGQMDGEAGWWTTCGNIGLPPLARVMGVGRQQQVNVLLSKMNKTTCMFDPFPTVFLLNFSHLFIDVIVRIINLSFSNAAFKSVVVKPLLKNLHLKFQKKIALFLTYHTCLKLIEKVIAMLGGTDETEHNYGEISVCP